MTDAMTDANDPSRYSRQTLLPGWGESAQRRLAGSAAMIVGCGALGGAVADHLARTGVGRLVLVDRDVVELSNLQRQTLFDEHDARRAAPKAAAAQARLRRVNSSIRIDAFPVDFTSRNAQQVLDACLERHDPDAPADVSRGSAAEPSTDTASIAGSQPIQPSPPASTVIIDGTDNFETRFLLNDLAVQRSIPLVYGGVVGTTGMQTTIIPGVTACLRCLFDSPPPPGTYATCDTAGVLAPTVAIVAAHQAADALRLLAELPVPAVHALLEIDPLRRHVRRLGDTRQSRRRDCPCCVLRRFEFLSGQAAQDALLLCGRDTVQISPARADAECDLRALAQRLAPHGEFSTDGMLLQGSLSSPTSPAGDDGATLRITVFRDGRTLIRGTRRTDLARSIHARFIGS
jgi:molybdopterin-synthase adenylyltransferase